jgi:hypothetical protein
MAYANITDFVVRRLSDAVPDTDAQTARHLISVIEGLRWPVLFGVYTERVTAGQPLPGLWPGRQTGRGRSAERTGQRR